MSALQRTVLAVALGVAGCTAGDAARDAGTDATTYTAAYCAHDPRAQRFAVGQTATTTSGLTVQIVAVSPDPAHPCVRTTG